MSAVRLVVRENPINTSVVWFEQLLTDFMYIHTYCLTYNIVLCSILALTVHKSYSVYNRILDYKSAIVKLRKVILYK